MPPSLKDASDGGCLCFQEPRGCCCACCRQLVRLANPQAAEGVTPRDLAQLIARFAANNHTICDDELRPVGTLLHWLPDVLWE